MVFPDLAVSAIYTVLCLVPGFISLRTVTYLTDIDPDLTEFEKSTWSFVASGVSLSLTYFLFVTWLNLVSGEFVLVRSFDITWVELVAGYPLLLLVAVAVGYVAARLFSRRLDAPAIATTDTEG